MVKRGAKTMARWSFRLALAGALAVGIGYLPYRAYGPQGFGRVTRLQGEKDALVAETARLSKENKELAEEIRALKKDRRAAERVARDELGLVRPSDLVFVFE